MTAIGLGWRIHSSSAVVVAVTGPAASPVLVARERIVLLDDPAVQEPYHAATRLPLDEIPAFLNSVREAAAASATSAIEDLAASLGSVAAIGVVGGDRWLPELPRILAKHALLHAADRNLYEQAVIERATLAGLPVTSVPATGKLIDDASRTLGVDLPRSLEALGKAAGPPWQKDHREATAAALLALQDVSR